MYHQLSIIHRVTVLKQKFYLNENIIHITVPIIIAKVINLTLNILKGRIVSIYNIDCS